MRYVFIFLGLLTWISSVSAQQSKPFTPKQMAAQIRPQDIRQHLEVLASDSMEGRETGQYGQRKAAAYIEQHFKKIGLDPTPTGEYQQPIHIAFNHWVDISVNLKGKKRRYMKDFYAFPLSNSTLEDTIRANEVVFLGYGIDHENYSDYEGVDVKDKVIMIYQGEPLSKDSVSYITGIKAYSNWALNWKKKLEAAKRRGVKAVLIIEPKINARVSRYRDRLLSGQTSIGSEGGLADNFANSIYISKGLAKSIIGKKHVKKVIKARKRIQKKGKPRAVIIPTNLELVMQKNERTLKGSNVLGFIEGRDPVLSKEIVVVSAHYDHLGKRGNSIYNGADDNGSGSSTVMEIATTIAAARDAGKGPLRSMLFLLVSGEEKGLLGSAYYTKYPVYPLEKTIVDVNVDMIGRVDDKHDTPNYVYVIGADRLSTELHTINEDMNEKYTQLELDYTYNAEDDPNRYYYRSDHYNFAEKGIPAIFYFSGTHEDYHRTSDTVDKINFDKTAKIGKLIFHTVWQIANQPKTIEVDVKPVRR